MKYTDFYMESERCVDGGLTTTPVVNKTLDIDIPDPILNGIE